MTTRRLAKAIIFFFLILVLIASGLASCTTVNKTKSSVKQSTDSTAAVTAATVAIRNIDSAVVKTIDSSYSQEITFTFEPEKEKPRNTTADSVPVNDYEAARLEPFAFEYYYNGETFKTPRPVLSVTIKTKGQLIKKDSAHVIKNDSSSNTNTQTVQVKKTHTATAAAKKTTRLFPWWWIAIFIAAAGGITYALKRYNLIDRFFS